MKKLTKKLLITTSGVLGLLTIGVGTSIALSSCAKKELKLENFSEWTNKDKINALNEVKTTLNNRKLFNIKPFKELKTKDDRLTYDEKVSTPLYNWLNNKKTNPNKLIMKLIYDDLKLKVKNKEDFSKKVDPLIKDINYPINNGFFSNLTEEVWNNINTLIDLYVNLYKSL